MSKISIVMYHYVRDLKNSRYPKIKGLDYKLFKEQIKFFKENFNIVTMEEVIASYDESYDLPENAVLLTFDDGYIDHFTNVLPILNEEKIQGSFFIPVKAFKEHVLLDVNKIHFILASTDINILLNELYKQMDYYRGLEYDIPSNQELFNEYAVANRFDDKETIFVKRMLQTVLPEDLRNKISSNLFEKYIGLKEDVFARELYMNYGQIKYMKNNGMYIGVHGYDHYWLGRLEKSKMQQDIKMALDGMEDLIDRNSWAMNYPYGSNNQDVVDFISENGCKLGLTVEVGQANIISVGGGKSRFLLPRFDTNDFPPKSEKYKEYINN